MSKEMKTLTINGEKYTVTDGDARAKLDKMIVTSGGGDTMTWDGNTEGLVSVSVEGMTFCKVSEAIPAMRDFTNGYSLAVGAHLVDRGADNFIEFVPGVNGDVEALFYVIAEEAVGVDNDGVVFPAAGVYFAHTSERYTSSLTIPGYTGFATEKIKPEYIPEHKHSYIVTEDGDTLTWDGNTKGMANVGETFYKVSDAVPTLAELSAGGTFVAINGVGDIVTSSFSSDDIFVRDDALFVGDSVLPGAIVIDEVAAAVNQVEKGTYFVAVPEVPGVIDVSFRTVSLTINGYTGFGSEKLDPKYLPEHLQFGTVYGDTLTFDGNTDGLVSVEGMLFKVSDAVPTYADIAKGGYVTANGEKQAFSAEDFSEDEVVLGGGVLSMGPVTIVPPEAVGVLVEGITFPAPGTYFAYSVEAGMLTTELQLNGYTGFTSVKKLEPKYVDTQTIFFLRETDTYLYLDVNCTTKVTHDVLLRAVKSGSIALHGCVSGLLRVATFPAAVVNAGAYCMVYVIDLTNGSKAYYTAEYTGS